MGSCESFWSNGLHFLGLSYLDIGFKPYRVLRKDNYPKPFQISRDSPFTAKIPQQSYQPTELNHDCNYFKFKIGILGKGDR
ncbi:hypothetical protein [Pseudanabaena sp. UWO310]|uniref:hypothetical protein n=1 Tax=Pseudanabaena sp. UWO310 TaxID=2480795 RepID=UPI001680D3DE|nr:hypothetical protein [Pseudanabaena sp. UWO310]